MSTNAIESTFATVRLRTKKTKGACSRAAGLAMAYKLLDAAQARWRCVNAPHLVALVRAGAWRGSAARPPPLSRPKRSVSRSTICSTESTRVLTAASSIASGRPSSRRQTNAEGY
jgi:hypothetical protein